MSTARELDQFYTHPAIAQACFDQLLRAIPPSPDAIFLEPSAGNGAFFNLMPADRRLGFDLEPRCPDVQLQDFLAYTWPADHSRTITVGNPPFGKNASLAVAFFNHAAKFSETVAFIVPKTFRKASLIKRLDKNFKLLHDNELPADAFLFQGRPYNVPCCFQIWVRTQEPRIDVQGPTGHEDFEYVPATEADFAVRKIGALAGKVLKHFVGYSASSHYYIKSNINVDEIVSRLKELIRPWSMVITPDTPASASGNW